MVTTTQPRQQPGWWVFLLAPLPIVIAGLLHFCVLQGNGHTYNFPDHSLETISTDDAQRLQAIFAGADYAWPPAGPVPALAVRHLPDNLTTLNNTQKKALFFRALLPLILSENARIARQRAFVKAQFSLQADGEPFSGKARLQKLALHYRVTQPLDDPTTRQRLLRRIDTVPTALVLAQAATESGWGTSRFARQANNLFGVWTWNADEGLAPRQADPDSDHYVRVFPNLQASVRDYLYNINVGHAYLALRKTRARLRAGQHRPDALQLASALEQYSQRGAAYVADIKAMIRYNGLTKLAEKKLELALPQSIGLAEQKESKE